MGRLFQSWIPLDTKFALVVGGGIYAFILLGILMRNLGWV